MTTRALFIDGVSFARRQSGWPVGMNLVTGGAGKLILRMAALQTADVGWLIQMAGETDFVRGLRCEFGGIADFLSPCPFGMFLSRTVARIPGLPFPPTPGIRSSPVVG